MQLCCDSSHHRPPLLRGRHLLLRVLCSIESTFQNRLVAVEWLVEAQVYTYVLFVCHEDRVYEIIYVLLYTARDIILYHCMHVCIIDLWFC